MSQISGLFPTPLMRVERLLPVPLVQALIARHVGTATQRNTQDNRLTHTEILTEQTSPELIQLRSLLTPKLAEFGELLFGEKLAWSIKELWLNVLETGGHQAIHNHANCFVSGVLYLTPTHPSASTVFVKALGGNGYVFANAHRNTRPGPFNSDKWMAPEAAPGDLILFPSHLLHEVPANQGGRRITLAFNAIPERLDSWGYALRFARA